MALMHVDFLDVQNTEVKPACGFKSVVCLETELPIFEVDLRTFQNLLNLNSSGWHYLT